MLSALALTVALGVTPTPTPIAPLQKPAPPKCPARVAAQSKTPAPPEAKMGKLILVNASPLRLNEKKGQLCPIPLADPRPGR